jgi:hypothetical protein
MKSSRLLLIIFFLAFMNGFSQSLSLFYKGALLEKTSVITRGGTPDSIDLTTFLTIRNDAQGVMQVQAKKTEMAMIPGAAASICWADYCYPPDVNVSDHPLTLTPGESKTSCFAHLITTGIPGTSTIRWTYFDQANPADSVSVIINYITYPAGIEEQGAGNKYLVAFPNPAAKEVTVRFRSCQTDVSSLFIQNSSGVVVLTKEIRDHQDEIRLDLAGFPTGLYLISIRSCDKVMSGKFIKH